MSDTMALSVRLDNLPRKVAVPFRDLLQRGHVTEDVLTSVIDAGDLAGEVLRGEVGRDLRIGARAPVVVVDGVDDPAQRLRASRQHVLERGLLPP